MTALTMRRNAILRQIGNNPFSLSLRRPTTSATPGSGVDRVGPPYSTVSTGRDARVAFKVKPVPELSEGTPQATAGSWFLLTDYRAVPVVKDQFVDGESRSWEIMNVAILSKFGGPIGYESDLRRIDATA